MQTIGIIGAGAWGTALAVAARRAGRAVVLKAREPEVALAINASHENPAFLPGVTLDPGIVATTDVAPVLATDCILLVAPAQTLAALCRDMAPQWPAGLPAVICAKGIEQDRTRLLSDAIAEALPQAPLAVLSGPTFAAEVARGLPTAVTLACADPALGTRIIEALGSARFRPYLSTDLRGAEIGGAVKNVLAIACGIVTGLGLGDNARASLITRGLAEITRLGMVLGARPETLMGLSGIGDLILTCTSGQSRNFSLGLALGEGRKLADVLSSRKVVVEGVYTAPAVAALARRYGVELPICAAVDAVLHHDLSVGQAVERLLARPFTKEII